MTICESCGEIEMNGLGPYCRHCENEIKEWADIKNENDDCKRCGGSGEIDWDDGLCSEDEMIECYVCKGTGVIE